MALRIEGKATFLHITKNAGTSVTRLVRVSGAHQQTPYQHDTWHDLPDAWRDRVFAIVRNPWDRCLSQYNFLVMKSRDRAGWKSATMRRVNREQSVLLERGFTHFIEHLQDHEFRKDEGRRAYLWPEDTQHRFLPADPARVRLLRFERLAQDWRDLVRDWDLALGSLEWHNRSREQRGYREHYDSHTREVVGRIFREDVDRLGYEF
jgi:hypothetical protein